MSVQLNNCRFCNLPFSPNDVDAHELICNEKSQKQAHKDANQTNEEIANPTKSKLSSFKTSSLPPDKQDKAKSKTESPQQCQSSPGQQSINIVSSSSSYSYGMDPKRNLFPPTKKFRYYPVTCDYCGKRFQPTKLKAHQQKKHFKYVDAASTSGGHAMSVSANVNPASKKKITGKAKSAGGMPKSMRICYICGQMYGTRSLKIHEPKCLEKWKIQNDQLPRHMRAPQPVKPEPEEILTGSDKSEYSVPDYDPANEAAYRSHLKNLIACCHCSRTFSPDRIMKHQSCCIGRPRTRKRVATPKSKRKT